VGIQPVVESLYDNVYVVICFCEFDKMIGFAALTTSLPSTGKEWTGRSKGIQISRRGRIQVERRGNNSEHVFRRRAEASLLPPWIAELQNGGTSSSDGDESKSSQSAHDQGELVLIPSAEALAEGADFFES
ncbi:unnamed protein product, partial [Amoebophrya sp. A25]